jgi:hypothetical protein
MNNNVLLNLVIFIAVLLGLNYFFHLHISIIGSLILTLGLNFVFGRLQSRSS